MPVEIDTKLQHILSWYKQLKEERLPWEKIWYDISKFLDPRTESLYTQNSPATRTGTYIYDGTPINAHRMLVDGLMGYLISPALKWFKIRMAKRELEELPGVKGYLEAVDQHFYDLFQRSNFYVQMPSFLSVGSSVGTATIYREKNRQDKTFHFITLHPMSVYIGTDSFGKVNVVFREFKLRARNMLENFSEEELSVEMLEEIEQNPERKYRVLHTVFSRKQRFVTKNDKTNKKWASFYILLDKSLDKSGILRESGYDSFPYNVWWWYKNAYETYGRSPAYDALTDIMALNQMGKTLLEAAHKSVNPPLNVPGSMKGRLKIKPSGMNYYDNPEEIVRPIDLGINYPIGVDREEKKQDIIKKHFRVEFFLMLANATRRMTATEIVERQSEKAALMEAPIARLGSDALNPIFDSVYEAEYKAGNLPEIPASLQGYGMENLEIDYTGPLAQAQKRLFKTQGADRSLEKLIPILQINPQVRDNVDWDELARIFMDAENMPQNAIIDKGKVADIRQRRMQALIQQQQMAVAEKQADIANKLGKKVEPGSLLEQGQENV